MSEWEGGSRAATAWARAAASKSVRLNRLRLTRPAWSQCGVRVVVVVVCGWLGGGYPCSISRGVCVGMGPASKRNMCVPVFRRIRQRRQQQQQIERATAESDSLWKQQGTPPKREADQSYHSRYDLTRTRATRNQCACARCVWS